MTHRCAHCRRTATDHWTLRACADGRRKRVIMLCAACDADLNELVLSFGRVRGRAAMMKAYRRARGVESR